MNKEDFNSNCPGQLIQINIQNEQDWAFIPDKLPSDWKIPAEMWPLLSEAKEELARLDGVGKHIPKLGLLLKPLQKREALRSSSLEGTYATPEQILLFEMDPKEPKSKNDPLNARKEVVNYSNALKAGQEFLTELPISIRFLKKLHYLLLHGVRGYHRDPGNFRKAQVHIGSDRRFIPPPPTQAMEALNDLEVQIHSKHKIDPLIFCFMVHYQFETIHPFLDGNGRVGRLLLSLMIYKFCNISSPWLYLSAYFDRYKDEYINNLYNISARNDWSAWLSFCLRATTFQAKDSIRRFDKLVTLKEQYLTRITSISGHIRLNRLIEHLFETPVINVPQAAKMLEVTYPTAKADIELLQKARILADSQLPNRPRIYFAPEILKFSYSDNIE